MPVLKYRDPVTGDYVALDHGSDHHVRKDGDVMSGPLLVQADVSGMKGTFIGGVDVGGGRVQQVGEPIEPDDAATKDFVSKRILYGPVANRPATLEPGQLFAGF